MAQANLALCYENGKGIAVYLREEVKWQKRAAEAGDTSAQINLGHCYEYGEGIAAVKIEAVKWYTLAAKAGYSEAGATL